MLLPRGLPWRRFIGLLCLGALIGVGPDRTYAAFSSSSSNDGSSFSSARIFSGQRSTTAWMVHDAAAGSESVQSNQRAFADGNFTTTKNWSSTWSTARYVEFELNSPLAAGLPVSDAAFSFTYADNENPPANQFCYYFQVRRTSTGAVLATHGSTSSPISCEPRQTPVTVSTPIPSVSSTDLANDVTIRVFGQHTSNRAARIDAANVTGTVFSSPYTQYSQIFVDAADTSAATTRWGPAVPGDGAAYQTAGNWAASFASTRYLTFSFPAYVPGGGVVTGASIDHSYKSATSGDTSCWYMEVYNSSTLLATKGSTGTPLSCNSTTSFVTDTVSIPEVNNPNKANNVVIRIYARNSGSRRTDHDLVRLNLIYSLPSVGSSDVTPPAGADIQTANASGGTAGRAEIGDQVTYTFTEAMDPASLITGWDGTSRNVIAYILDGGTGDDTLYVWDPVLSANANFGSVDLNGDFVSSTVVFGSSGTPSTIVMSGSAITVTLGTLSSGTALTDSTTTPMAWTPSAAATDLAGNPCSTGVVNESGAADAGF